MRRAFICAFILGGCGSDVSPADLGPIDASDMALSPDFSVLPDLTLTPADRCKDGIRDGLETDVDCGGGTCGRCELGGHCEAPATGPRDCLSGVCSTNQACVVSQCVDGVSDGTETDLDCGGSCAACPDGKHCKLGADCASGHCYVNFEYIGYCYSCTPSQCTTPPPPTCMPVAGCGAPTNYCRSNVLATSFAVPGACDANAHCTYSAAQVVTCANGCSNGACNTFGPSFTQNATPIGPMTTLDIEPDSAPSAGVAPANASVDVFIRVAPVGSLASMWLRWTYDGFATTLTTQLSVSAGGPEDTYFATIPAQPSGTTVRFNFDGTAWDGSTHIFSPNPGARHTYVTQ